MKKTLIIIIWLLILSSTAHSLGNNNSDIALKNYNSFHYRSALYYFERALAEKQDSEKADFINYAIKALKENKSFLNGIEKDEIAIKRRKNNPALADSLSKRHLAFAQMLMRDKCYLAMVESHLKRSIKLDPKNPEAFGDLGNAYYLSMNYLKGIENYDAVIRLSPGSLSAYRMAGDSCVAIGDFDKAKKYYSDLLKINEKAQFQYPAEETEKIRKIISVLPETYKDIDSLMKAERFDDAELILKKRLSLNAADYVAMSALGDIYMEKSDRKNAERLYRSAIEIAPDYPIAHLLLGRLKFLSRDYDAAVKELNIFKEKMRLLPRMDKETKKRYVNDLYYLSHVYFTLKRYEEARGELEEVLKIDPKEQDAYYDLGVYYYVYEHSRSKAYTSFKKAIDLNSSSDTAKSAGYAVEFMRSNPDSRFAPDFSFIDRE